MIDATKMDINEYLQERYAKVDAKALRLLGEEDADWLLSLWKMQYYRERAEWYEAQYNRLQRKIAHGCTDMSCKTCDVEGS